MSLGRPALVSCIWARPSFCPTGVHSTVFRADTVNTQADSPHSAKTQAHHLPLHWPGYLRPDHR